MPDSRKKGIKLEHYALFISIIGLFLSLYAAISANNVAIKANELTEKVINMTSSKYAYVEPTLSEWLYDRASYSFSSIRLNDTNRLGLNIVNTGQLNTGDLQISDRYSLDKNLLFPSINLIDLESKKNFAFWLNFTVKNDTNIIGLHKITLTVVCINCLEQGPLINKDIYVCIYNDTIHKNLERGNKDCW